MDRFTAMLARLGLRGSSDDDLGGKGQRSSQSTPRMSRNLIRDPNPDGRRSFGSLGSMENYRVRPRDRSWESERLHSLNRSWDLDHVAVGRDLDRVPGGCDRSWEAERARGMELLYQSMEREKERRRERGRDKKDKSRPKKKKKHRDRDYEVERTRGQVQGQVQGHDRDYNRERSRSKDRQAEMDAQKLSRERLERRMEELNRQLLEEKQLNRRDKLMVARLQRDMARQKSEGPLRETLMKELERERMLRVDAEQRLREMTIESDTTKTRLKALQDEFKQMEEMVQSVMQYKKKIDELKQEKTTMMINYENNLQKYRTQISHQEHENKILEAEVNKLESQCGNCHLCFNNDLSYRVSIKQQASSQSDDEEKSKVLLERLKMMEAEKTGLVLENENQRQQYEKCLDEIANQVVSALMSQKTLREECAKLQRRVLDLEEQNRQLNYMFQQRIRFASDSVLQSLSHKGVGLRGAGGTRSNSSSSSSLPTRVQGAVSQRGASHSPHQLAFGDHTASPFSEVSLESLQSMCSDYNEQVNCEESLSSPPPWLKDKLFSLASPTSSIASPTQHTHTSTSAENTPGHTPGVHHQLRHQQQQQQHQQHQQPSCEQSPGMLALATGTSVTVPSQHRMETSKMVPADKSEKDSQNTSLQNPQMIPKIETEFPATNSSPKVKHIGVIYQHKHREVTKQDEKDGRSPSEHRQATRTGGSGRLGVPPPVSRKPSHLNSNTGKKTAVEDASPGQELLKLTDSFHEKYMINQHDGLPHIQNMLDSDGDSDSPSQCQSQHYSVASTVSLNELLEQGLDDVQTPTDDQFSSDNFGFGDSEDEEDKDDGIEKALSMGFHNSLVMNGHTETVSLPKQISCSCQTSPSLDEPCALCTAAESTELATVRGPEKSKNTGQSEDSLLFSVQRPSALPLTGRELPLSALPSSQQLASPAKSMTNGLSNSGQAVVNGVSTLATVGGLSNTSSSLASGVSNTHSSTTTTVNQCVAIATVSVASAATNQNVESRVGDKRVINEKAGASVKIRPAVKPKPARKPTPSKPGTVEEEKAASNITKHVQKQPSADSAHQDSPVLSQSSTSPDSAMQHSFSSSSSSCDTTLVDKPSYRDDGYSSQSAVSVTNGDGCILSLPPAASTPSSPQTTTMTTLQNGYHGNTDEVAGSTTSASGRVRNMLTYFEGRSDERGASSENIDISTCHQTGCVPGKQTVAATTTSVAIGNQNGAIIKERAVRRKHLSSNDLSHSDSCIYPASACKNNSIKRGCGCLRAGHSLPQRTRSDCNLSYSRRTILKKKPPPVPKRPSSTHLKPTNLHHDPDHATIPKLANGTAAGSHMTHHNEVYVGHVMLQDGVPNLASYGLPSLGYPTTSTRLPSDSSSGSAAGHFGKKLLEMRDTCEGSESGYRSEDSLRPDAIGSEGNLAYYEAIPQGPLYSTSGVRMGHLSVAREPQMSWMMWSSDSEGDETPVNYVELWRRREGPAVTLPEWNPKATANSLKQKVTPSPLACKTMDSTLSSEQWLLGFSKADIEKHTSPERTFPSFADGDINSTPCQSSKSPEHSCQDAKVLDNPWTSGSIFGNEIIYIDPERAAFVDCVKAFDSVESSDDASCDVDLEAVNNAESNPEQGSGNESQNRAVETIVPSTAVSSSKVVSDEAKEILQEISKCKIGLPKQSSLTQSLDELEREYQDLALCDNFQQQFVDNSQSADSVTACDIECSQSADSVTACDIDHSQSAHSIRACDMHNGQSATSMTTCDFEQMDISPSTDDTPTDERAFASALHELCPQFPKSDAYARGLPGRGALSSLAFDWSPIEEDSGFEQTHENERESTDISRQIEDLTRTVDDLQRSLSSLDADSDVARRYSSSSDGDHCFDRLTQLSPTELHEVCVLDPEVRANMLDEMIVSSSSDGDPDDDDDDGGGTDPARGLLSKFRHKRRKKKLSKLEAVRQVNRPRPSVDYKKLFVRYSHPEQRAMDSFSFLEEYPSSATQSEDEGGRHSPRVRGHGGQVQKRGATIKLGCGSLEQVPELSNTSADSSRLCGTCSGDADTAKDQRGSDSSGDSEDVAHLQSRTKPQHKTVQALKEECRYQAAANRLSSSSFDSQTSCSGLSLSDSCCESFSSSSPSINDVTFL